MDFNLSAEQRDIVSVFAGALSRESSIERVRAAELAGFDESLWKVLAAMDAVGTAAPTAGEGGLVDFVLVAEVVGASLACVPFVEAAVAARVLAVAGVDAPAGAAPIVFSPLPARDRIAFLVPGGAAADGVIALDGDDLVLAKGASGRPLGDIGFLGTAHVELVGDGIERVVLAHDAQAHGLFRDAVGWWRLGTAASCAGIAGRAIDVAAEYAKTREQFGVPIGTFQAIQHLLAEVVMASDGAKLLTREAAWKFGRDMPGWRAAADIAYAHAAESAVAAAEACLHVHGGYGYTLEYEAQLFLRRAKGLQLAGGTPDEIWASIGAAAVGGGL